MPNRILITGANRGVGLALVHLLQKLPSIFMRDAVSLTRRRHCNGWRDRRTTSVLLV